MTGNEKKILKIIKDKLTSEKGNLSHIVKDIDKKKKKILELVSKHKTPFYVVDFEALEKSIRNFQSAFHGFAPFYAIKANNHPSIIQAVLSHGFGLDVSSGEELKLARKFNAKQIIFSGPGKTIEELESALDYQPHVTVHIDSFSELKKLGELSGKRKTKIRAGVRFFSSVQGKWSKFGIPLKELKKFWQYAEKFPYINLQGLQFHMSWNRNAARHRETIKELAEYLKRNFTSAMRRQIKFMDFGGGFFPDQADGYYPWTAYAPEASPLGHIIKTINNYFGIKTRFPAKYYVTRSTPLNKFAENITEAIELYLEPIVKCSYYTEPGRIICNNAMHIVVKVLDKKRPDQVITDGGINMVGWEYGENFYYPITNLTHPALKEIRCTIFGPLCTPRDVWGYSCYAEKINEGDVLVIPNQGAYKYVLAQNFIKSIPEVYSLR